MLVCAIAGTADAAANASNGRMVLVVIGRPPGRYNPKFKRKFSCESLTLSGRESCPRRPRPSTESMRTAGKSDNYWLHFCASPRERMGCASKPGKVEPNEFLLQWHIRVATFSGEVAPARIGRYRADTAEACACRALGCERVDVRVIPRARGGDVNNPPRRGSTSYRRNS